MNDVKKLLTEEIGKRLESMDEIPMGSPDDKEYVENLNKLLGKLNEMEKIKLDQENAIKTHEDDYRLKLKQMEIENELKELQMKEDRHDRLVKNGLTLLSLLVGTGVTVWGVIVSINFEKEGTITTQAGRALLNRLFPKK